MNNRTPTPTRGVAEQTLRGLRKIPLTPKSTPFAKRYAENATRGDVESAHVGYLAGANGIVIVDLDRKNGQDGVRLFAHIMQSAGLSRKITTLATGTRHGGYHVFYKEPDLRLPNTANVFGLSGVDIRSGKGYVRDYPSPGYRLANNLPIAAMPEPLVQFFADKLTEREAESKRRVEAQGGTARHSLQGLLSTVYNARTGQRNHTLFWAASRVAEMPVGRHRTALRQLERAAAEIGLPQVEVENTIASAMRAGAT